MPASPSPRSVNAEYEHTGVKLLFDQNVSPRLCRVLSDVFADSAHVRELGLRDADEATIWEYATRHGFAVLTKDAGFRQRSFLFGHPPKIVSLRVGNCSARAIEALPRSRAADIEAFLTGEQKSILGLS